MNSRSSRALSLVTATAVVKVLGLSPSAILMSLNSAASP